MAYYMHNLIIPNAFAQNCHLRGIFQQAKRDNREGKKTIACISVQLYLSLNI